MYIPICQTPVLLWDEQKCCYYPESIEGQRLEWGASPTHSWNWYLYNGQEASLEIETYKKENTILPEKKWIQLTSLHGVAPRYGNPGSLHMISFNRDVQYIPILGIIDGLRRIFQAIGLIYYVVIKNDVKIRVASAIKKEGVEQNTFDTTIHIYDIKLSSFQRFVTLAIAISQFARGVIVTISLGFAGFLFFPIEKSLPKNDVKDSSWYDTSWNHGLPLVNPLAILQSY